MNAVRFHEFRAGFDCYDDFTASRDFTRRNLLRFVRREDFD